VDEKFELAERKLTALELNEAMQEGPGRTKGKQNEIGTINLNQTASDSGEGASGKTRAGLLKVSLAQKSH